jgi:hypothetical protein
VRTRVEESQNLQTSVSENTGPFVEVYFHNKQDARQVHKPLSMQFVFALIIGGAVGR